MIMRAQLKCYEATEDDLQVPDVFFYLFDHWAVHNVATNEVTLMKLTTSEVDLEQWQMSGRLCGQGRISNSAILNQEAAINSSQDESELEVSFAGADFEAAVRKIQELYWARRRLPSEFIRSSGKALQATPIRCMRRCVRLIHHRIWLISKVKILLW